MQNAESKKSAKLTSPAASNRIPSVIGMDCGRLRGTASFANPNFFFPLVDLSLDVRESSPHSDPGYSLAKLSIRRKEKIVIFTRINEIRKVTTIRGSLFHLSRNNNISQGWCYRGKLGLYSRGAPFDRVPNRDMTPVTVICTNPGNGFCAHDHFSP